MDIQKTPGMYLDLIFKILDPSGNVINAHKEEGHSYVANFARFMFGYMGGNHEAEDVDGNQISWTDTLGTPYQGSIVYTWADASSFTANAGSGVDTYGIVLGRDDGATYPKGINNYKLGTQIAHGTGGGGTPQIQYGSHSVVNPTHDGATYSYAGITRSFSVNNGLGDSVIIKEMGLIVSAKVSAVSAKKYLIVRDILASQVTVPDGSTLLTTYNFKALI